MARRGMLAAAIALVACGGLAPGSSAASSPATSSSSLTVTGGFVPTRLGAASTMELGFRIHRSAGETPQPVVGVEFELPAGVSLTTSELGLEVCDPAVLESAGPKGCKPNAVMGYGSALILAPDTAEAVLEPVKLTVFIGPPQDRHTTLLFYESGSSPVITQQLFSGQMLEDAGPFGADLNTTLPLTSGLPGESDTTVVQMQAGIGPKGVTYYKSVNGVRTAYTPKGLAVPSRCPAGGFPFGVTLRFANGSTESASTRSPCPSSSGSARHPRRRSR